MDRQLLDEQIAYYEARAVEYDETSVQPDDPAYAHTRILAKVLEGFEPSGRVLEFACGTGNWTARVAQHADEVLAVDASEAMLEIARSKVDAPNVRFEHADVFEWQSEQSFDVVLFCFWLSHVPVERFAEFWTLVANCLVPGGRVFFIDEGRHELWEEIFVSQDVVRRELRDGSHHRVVKRFWDPKELERELKDLGWSITVSSVGPFYWGGGKRA